MDVLRLLQLDLQAGEPALALAELLLPLLEPAELAVDLLLLLEHPCLDPDDLCLFVLDLLVDLAPQPDGQLARFDLGLPADGLGIALGVGEDPLPLLGGRLEAVPERRAGQPRTRLRPPPRGRSGSQPLSSIACSYVNAA